jgi:toxin ParE1/3/4
MKQKIVIPREMARLDVEAAIDYFHEQGLNKFAQEFIDVLEQAYARISHCPEGGSLRYAHELSIDALRFVRLERYPWLVFYVEQAEHVEIWRVLHEKRDIPRYLRAG